MEGGKKASATFLGWPEDHEFMEIRESHFTAKSLNMLFQDISPEKEINILGEKKIEIIFSYVCVTF